MGLYEAVDKLTQAANETNDHNAKVTLLATRYFLVRAVSRKEKRWMEKIDHVIAYVLRGNYAMCDDAIRKMLNKRNCEAVG